MYSRPSTPKTIGGVLDDIFKLFSPALAACWPIAIIASIAISLPSFYIANKSSATPEDMIAMFTEPTFWLLYLIAMILYFVFYAALLARIEAVANDRDSSVAEAINIALRLAPRMLGASLLYLLAIFVGMILLVVPGIIWSVSMMLYSIFIVVEDSPAVESLSRSRQLVKGDWWRTLAILSIAMIVAYLLVFCVQFVIGLAAGMSGDDMMTTNLLATVVTAVLYIVILPFIGATSFSIYYDLKLRKEGDDLTQRVESLAKA
jgi:hypothetical protein